MFKPTRLSSLLCLLPAFVTLVAFAQGLDPSKYNLTSAAADKFVKATQQIMANGGMPQGVNPLQNLPQIKAAIDGNPAALKAVADSGLSSTDYALFMGAAAQAMAVGQMEAAGMKGMLPPGVTARPPQANIDFMKANMDIFQRSMAPPGSAAASARPRANTSDEALPMPALSSLWPSDALGKLPKLTTINAATDCKLGGLQDQVQREQEKATQLQAANYGNPGNSGLARTPAEGAVLKRLEDSELDMCANPLGVNYNGPAATAAEAAKSAEHERIAKDYETSYNACPGIAGGKEPACEKAVAAKQAAQTDAAERRYLAAIAEPFDAMVGRLKTCSTKIEAVVRDAVTAKVSGANVKLVLRPLVTAWQPPLYATALWSGACEEAQRNLLKK